MIVAELPLSHQQAFRLWWIEEFTQRQIAEKLQVSTRTVTNYIREATSYCRFRLDGASLEAAKKWMKE